MAAPRQRGAADAERDLLPEGLADRLPAAAAAQQHVMRAALDACDAYGYDRVVPPSIEYEANLTGRMAGVARARMFRFVDPASLATLALRSDITVQVGRIAATVMADAPRPLRLCYAGQVVTMVGDGLSPQRERLQIGAELIGSDSVEAAAETIEVAVAALDAAGAGALSVDLTLPDLIALLGGDDLDPTRAGALRDALDAKDVGALVAAGGEAWAPLIAAAGPFEDAIARLEAFDHDGSPRPGALAPRIAQLRALKERIGNLATLTLDPAERHGFEYQSWLGFTLYAAGGRGAIGRGGTYRILSDARAGASSGEAASGFSLYPDALIDALAQAPLRRDCLFLPLAHDRAVAAALRAEGWRTRAALDARDNAAALGCTHRLDPERGAVAAD